MTQASTSPVLFGEIIDRVSVGIFVVNKNFEIMLWNRYMENYSQKKSDEVIGKNLFELFPGLSESWLKQKIRNVFILRNFSFTSWEHRPYLFKFMHNRPITGGVDYMRQNCIFSPVKGESGEIESVCITIMDVTDTSIYEGMLKNAVRSLAEASNRDGLTNVYNRRYLEQTMSKEFARMVRYGGTLSFIIIDLDHFKHINDNFGHLAGDEILRVISKKITECLRNIDVLARYGGEEFAVLLPETPIDGAEILAKRLCQHVAAQKIEFEGTHIPVTASLGVAEFSDDLKTHEQLISKADIALYKSKDSGRNQVTVYSPELETAEKETEPEIQQAAVAAEESTSQANETAAEESTPPPESEVESVASEPEAQVDGHTEPETQTSEENVEAETSPEDVAPPDAETVTETQTEQVDESISEEQSTSPSATEALIEEESAEELVEDDIVTETSDAASEQAEEVAQNDAETEEIHEEPEAISEEQVEPALEMQAENEEKVIYITIGN